MCPVPRIVEVHTRWRRRDTADDRNHRCRRNEMQIRGGGKGGGGREDTSELHFKMLRVSKSTVPSILATISLSPSIFLFSASLFSTSTREHVFFYNINIDDETDYFAVSLNKKYLKKIFRY